MKTADVRTTRWLLVIGLIGANLVICLMAWQSSQGSKAVYEQQAQTLTLNVASSLDQTVSASIRRIDLALLAVVDELENELAHRAIDAARMSRVIERYQQRLPEVEGFRVADADGRVFLGKGVQRADQVSWADRDYFIHHREHPGAGLDFRKPRIGRVARQYIVNFSRRFNGPDGRFAGVVSAPVAVTYFADLLTRFDLPSDSTLILRDGDLGLVARYPAITDQLAGQVGHSAVSAEFRALVDSGVQTASYHIQNSPDGFERTLSFRRLKDAPLLAIVGVSSHTYLAGWREEGLKTACLAGGFAVLSLLLGGLLLRMLRRSENDQARLELSEQQLRTIVETVPECVKVVDARGQLVQMNSAGLKLLEVESVEQLAKHDLIDFIRESDRPAFLDLHRRVIAGESAVVEFELVSRHGRSCLMESHAVPMMIEGEAVYLAVSRDITARKRAERDLEAHREHLEALVKARTAELRAAMEAAESSSRAKSTFLANMSHELRTPLNGIMGMIALAMPRMTDHAGRDKLAKAKLAADHLFSVINDILDISKIEANHLSLEVTDFRLSEVFGKLGSMFGDKALAKGIMLATDLPPRLADLALRGDPLRLGQILINLLGNAIKFTERGSATVAVALLGESAEAVRLRFTVSDSGIGIRPEDQGRLFRAFEQADSSMTRKYGGTGLGLAICKRLVALMGGEIGVRSVPGEGSTFWFEVSLGKAREMPASQAGRPGEVELQGVRRTHFGRRILVVEDEPNSQEVTRVLLEDAGLKVDVADHGEQAVILAAQHDYDLILMDMQMPHMNGIEATHAILDGARNLRTPILALTANAYSEDRARCIAAGMKAHLAKPISPPMLYAALLRWLPA